MYHFGVCTEEIVRPSVGEMFAAMREYGFVSAQFTFESMCGELLPLEIRPEWIAEIDCERRKYGIDLASLNGTFNMLASGAELERGLAGFANVVRSAPALGAKLITLCTGTRSSEGMWIYHRDNALPDAYADLCRTMEKLLPMAHDAGVCLGIEIEASNVIDTPEKARRILREMGSDHLKIIMDCANLFHCGDARRDRVRDIMAHAFELVGGEVMIAHAKDILETDGICFTYAGNGIIDFTYFADLLDEIGYQGDMLIHGTKSEAQLTRAIENLRALGRYA